MSQVLRRLSSISKRERSLISNQSQSWLHQWKLKTVEPNCQRKTVGVTYSSRQIQVDDRPAAGEIQLHRLQNGIMSFITRRNMSILTDLLRRKKKVDDDEDEAIPDAKTLPLLEETQKSLTDEEIEAKRNISRLNPQHQRLVKGEMPYTEPMMWIHHTVRYKQKMFGKYGESSGVNPGLMWPTREELQEKIEFEKISNPFTVQELVEMKRALRQEKKEAIERRIKDVEAKMAIVDKFKEDLVKRQEAKEHEADEARARREKLMEEVRRHFGYTIDPREEKFQELLAKKEKEQRKNMKEARKLEKQQKILHKLEGKPKTETKAPKTTSSAAEQKEDD